MDGNSLKRIGIDARMYGLQHAGIGRYVINLVDRLIESDLPVKWEVVTSSDNVKFFSNKSNVSVHVSDVRHYSLAEQTRFWQMLEDLHLDLLHTPHFNVPLMYNRPFTATIHDILWHHVTGTAVTTLPPWLYHLKHLGYRAIVSHTVSKAKALFVPSNFVKEDLLEAFPQLDANKVHVTYEGVSQFYQPPSSADPETDPYIVYVGSAYPHKNIPAVFKALDILKLKHKLTLKFVIVGSRNIFVDRLKSLLKGSVIEQQVVFAGSRSDEKVQQLMSRALCLVHPSLSEGFGLTGLEAMAAGCPVLAADSSCLPEIYRDAALFFDPNNPEELAKKLMVIMNDSSMRSFLIEAGKKQVEKYSWDTMVKQTIEVYRNELKL